jgi:hypothetical protein
MLHSCLPQEAGLGAKVPDFALHGFFAVGDSKGWDKAAHWLPVYFPARLCPLYLAIHPLL